jgi:CheY-like chemotaxis protein
LVFGRSLQNLYGISLEQAGCRVDSALDNDEAMGLYRTHGPYDLVLTDLIHLRDLFSRIRKANPEQAFAVVGSCSASTIRFQYKIPVLREGPRQQELIRLVESAIKPQVRVLLVIANPYASRRLKDSHALKGPEIEGYGQAWGMVVGIPKSFALELESDGNEALRHYRQRGPYDMVLSELRLPGLSGPELAAAIRSQSPTQRIVMITESKSVGPDIQQQLGDIPVINLKNPRTVAAMKRARMMRQYEDREGKVLLDWVEAAVRATYKKTVKKRA